VIRQVLHFTLTMLLTVSVAMAQDVSLRDDHPQQYVVVKGDTLWDIASRFLDEPWQWPAIWQANPQIENPHLIYPGDVVSLVYIDGRPVLQVAREGTPSTPPDTSGMETVKLSPQIRRVDRADPINAVPLDAIRPFLRDIRVLSPSEFEGLPYIVANEETKLNAIVTDLTYGRGLNARVGEEYLVVRLTNIYDDIGDPPERRRVLPKDNWRQVPNVTNPHESLWNQTLPWDKRPKNPVGYEVWKVSRVRVKQPGEISVLEIIDDRTEIKPGDFILPADDLAFDNSFLPQAMDNMPDDMYVIATTGAIYGVGKYQIVAISGGTRQGVHPGHVFSAFSPGPEVRDTTGYRWGSFAKEAKVDLPPLYNGIIMVFRSFGDISYAIVMQGERLVREWDILEHPKNRG
jgi:hypothetical protein